MAPKPDATSSIHGVPATIPKDPALSAEAKRLMEQNQKEAREKDAVEVWQKWRHGTLKGGQSCDKDVIIEAASTILGLEFWPCRILLASSL